MQQVKKMGPLQNILGMLPGAGKMKLDEAEINEKALLHVEAIVRSMTMKERENPVLLNASRKRRISEGSGRSVQEINKLLKQFEEMKKMMKQFSDMGKGGKRKGKKMPMGGFPFM